MKRFKIDSFKFKMQIKGFISLQICIFYFEIYNNIITLYNTFSVHMIHVKFFEACRLLSSTL